MNNKSNNKTFILLQPGHFYKSSCYDLYLYSTKKKAIEGIPFPHIEEIFKPSIPITRVKSTAMDDFLEANELFLVLETEKENRFDRSRTLVKILCPLNGKIKWIAVDEWVDLKEEKPHD